MIAFIIGLLIGAWVGVFLCALCIAAREEKREWRKDDDEV